MDQSADMLQQAEVAAPADHGIFLPRRILVRFNRKYLCIYLVLQNSPLKVPLPDGVSFGRPTLAVACLSSSPLR
jgi:hypothetical protein